MCVYFRLTLIHAKNQQSIGDIELDYELVSIEDYSISGKISPKLYKRTIDRIIKQ